MFYFVLVVVPVVVLSLTFLLAAFESSLTAGLWMSGAYALFIIVGTVAYRLYKKAYDWEQDRHMREFREEKAIRLSPDPKPLHLNEEEVQAILLKAQQQDEENTRATLLKSKQRDREIAAMTTRTWNRTPTTEEEEA